MMQLYDAVLWHTCMLQPHETPTILLQVSHERAELARQLSQVEAAMEEEQHSKKKLRRKLGKQLEESERQVVHLQQCLEDK